MPRANKYGVKRLDLTQDGTGGGGIVIAYDPPNHLSDEDAEDLAESLLDALGTEPKRYEPPKTPKQKSAEERLHELEKRAQAAERRAEAAEEREREAAAKRAARAMEGDEPDKNEPPPKPGQASLVRGPGGEKK